MKVWQGLVVVALLWAALYLPFLGANELRGEEARRILPAQTMLRTGDWLVPRIGGEEYSSKPPLINWTIAGMFALTGVENEWTARLPSVLWILAFALTATGMLAGRLGVWGGARAGLFFLVAFGMLDKGRTVEIDAMYAAQTGIAYVLWAVWWSEGKAWRAWVVPWFFLGLGLLAKGPAHLLFFYGAVGATLWLARRRVELVQGPHLLGLTVMLGLFFPWVWLNLRQVEAAEATTGVWWDQLAVRFSFGEIDWGDWLLLPVLMVKDFLPGSLLLALLWKLPATGGDGGRPEERWRWVVEGGKWALLGGLILLSLSPGFRPRYAMPLFGIGAVVVAELMRRGEGGSGYAGAIERWWRRLNQGGIAAVVLGAVFAVGVAVTREEYVWWQAWPGVVAGAALAVGWGRVRKWPPLVGACLVLAGAQILVFQFVRARDEVTGLYRPVAREVMAWTPDEERDLVFYRPGHLRFLFSLRRPYEEVTELNETVLGDAGYLAVRDTDLGDAAVQEVLREREGREVGRRQIEGRLMVFFVLNNER